MTTFRVGDKVRSRHIATVTAIKTNMFGDDPYSLETTWDTNPTWDNGEKVSLTYRASDLELVERAEPKIGSVWLHVGVDRYVYVGHDRFFPANKGSANRSYPRSDFGDKFVEVK